MCSSFDIYTYVLYNALIRFIAANYARGFSEMFQRRKMFARANSRVRVERRRILVPFYLQRAPPTPGGKQVKSQSKSQTTSIADPLAGSRWKRSYIECNSPLGEARERTGALYRSNDDDGTRKRIGRELKPPFERPLNCNTEETPLGETSGTSGPAKCCDMGQTVNTAEDVRGCFSIGRSLNLFRNTFRRRLFGAANRSVSSQRLRGLKRLLCRAHHGPRFAEFQISGLERFMILSIGAIQRRRVYKPAILFRIFDGTCSSCKLSLVWTICGTCSILLFTKITFRTYTEFFWTKCTADISIRFT